MKKRAKIVVIGAGSMSFGLSCLQDAFFTREVWGSELVLVDTDATALERMLKLAQCMNSELDAGYILSGQTDRRMALPDADFVIVSVAVNRLELWKQDFHVPQKYGVRHILGENGGPGALFHTLRNVPILLDICRDMEALCPDALLLNFTNPESRLCLAIHKYTKIKAIGLCHQVAAGIHLIGAMTGIDAADIDVKAFGLNHFTWVKDVRRRSTGEDLYPLLRQKEPDFDPRYARLTRYLFHRFGWFPTSGDGHLGEFIPYAHEMCGTDGYNYDGNAARRVHSRQYIDGLLDGTLPLNHEAHIWNEEGHDSMLTPSGEVAFAAIRGILTNSNEYLLSGNLPNDGLIANLPADAIVEVPAIASGAGIIGLAMGELPRPIVALCTGQVHVQHLCVDAAVTGDKNIALQALLVDPNVPTSAAAEGILNELLELQKDYLPQFQ